MTTEQSARQGRRAGISLDALVLLLVTGLTLHLDSFKATTFTTPALNAISVGLLGLYLALDILGQPLQAGRAVARRLYYGGKSAVLAGIVILVLLWPTVHMIGLRHASQPWMYVHDTSINVEEATKFLLAGKDPYTQTYFKTPLARWAWQSNAANGYGPNPALWLTDTFPGQELITVPAMLTARATLGWFDERFVYLLAFAVTVLLLIRLAPTPSTRLAAVAAVALNPLWVSTFIYGQNDILVLAEIVAVLWLSVHERWRLALLALAIGCATKQTTLILVPFYLWWLALRLGPTWRERLACLARLLPWLIVPFAAMVGPFALWNWPAFYDGNFGYVAGTVPHSYPIQGYDGWGMASFVLFGGLVPGPNAYFPFAIVQAAVALPLTIVLLRDMRASTPATVMLGAYALVLFPIFYFSRFFHQSYAAFVIALMLVAYLTHHPARRHVDDGPISLDLLVPLLLAPQFIAPPTNKANALTAAVTFGLLLAYALIAAVAPWPRLRLPSPRRYAAAARALVLAGLAYITVFARGLSTVTDSLRWNAPASLIHDTALQIQISAGELLKLHNPYTISFWQTPLPQLYISRFSHALAPRNLPLTHNPHLPLGFLLGAPLQGLFNWLSLLFDERYIYLVALLGLAAALTLLVETSPRQLALLGLVVLSPLFASALALGQDDVLVALALVLMLALLQRRRFRAAALAAGVACAFKLTAWPLAPLLLAYLAGLDHGAALSWRRRAMRVLARAWPLPLPLLASAAPFVVWNAGAFWSDVFAYPLGLMRDAVPLDVTWGEGFQSLGFGRVALDFGWARLDGAGYIGPWLALAAGLVVLWLVAVRLWRAPSLALLMGGYLVLLFTLEYFGRFMIDTALGYVVVLAPLAFFPQQPAAVSRLALLLLPSDDEGAVAV